MKIQGRIVIKDKITARSGVAVEKKNLGGLLFGATVGGYVGYKYGLTKEKKQVKDLFKSEQKYAQKAREKWGKKKSQPQNEDIIDVDFEEILKGTLHYFHSMLQKIYSVSLEY